MAIKRSFNVNDKNGRACLKCGRTLPKENMKDDTICTCVCGQRMFVDRYGSRAVLTVYERADLRRRATHTEGIENDGEITKLQKQFERARKDASEWKEAAEGLARMIEEIKTQTKE